MGQRDRSAEFNDSLAGGFSTAEPLLRNRTGPQRTPAMPGSLLIVLDDSKSSDRLLRYLGEFFAGNHRVRLCLFCPSPKTSPTQESGDTRRQSDKDKAKALADTTSQTIVWDARAVLRMSGVPLQAIRVCHGVSPENQTLGMCLMAAAKQYQCPLIVVARDAPNDLADQLWRELTGVDLWSARWRDRTTRTPRWNNVSSREPRTAKRTIEVSWEQTRGRELLVLYRPTRSSRSTYAEARLRFGTLAPARRASESPMAIACLRLVTRLPERPLRSVRCLRSCIARSTFSCAFAPYFAMKRSPFVPATCASRSPARRL
jgi:hypothetical protein